MTKRNAGTKKEKYDYSDWNGNGSSSSKDINLCPNEFEIFRENTTRHRLRFLRLESGTATEAAAAKILICGRMSLKFFVKTQLVID